MLSTNNIQRFTTDGLVYLWRDTLADMYADDLSDEAVEVFRSSTVRSWEAFKDNAEWLEQHLSVREFEALRYMLANI